MKERIERKLTEGLTIKKLEVVNNSHLHAGHIESDDSGDTHFDVIVEAEELSRESLVASHRKVKELLSEEFLERGLHALSIKIL